MMKTPWGELAVSDAHVHFFSHRFFWALAQQKGYVQADEAVARIGAALGWQMPGKEPETLAAAWAEELDRHGVSRAALIANIPGDEDSVAAARAALPGRFFGYFMLNPCAPDAETRVQRALNIGGMQGICLFPAMHLYSIQDQRLDPILALAARPGVVVFVHCGVLSVGVRNKLGLPSLFDMRFSNPIDLHAVALRYPQVRFVIPHFGAGYLREALMVCGLCPNVHLDTSSSNGWMRYQESEMDLKTVFRRALDVAGPGRLLFGTDSSFFPRGWNAKVFEAQAAALKELGTGEEDARAIFGGNLERLLSPA